jgi:hypothetical protein
MSTLPLLIQSSFLSLHSFGPAKKFKYEKFEYRRPNVKWVRYIKVEYEKVKMEMLNIKGLMLKIFRRTKMSEGLTVK